MARIAGVDLPREKRVEIGLTYVFGIGRKSNEILAKTGINPDTRVKDLTEEEAAKLREVIERDYNVEGDLRREIGLNIKRLVEIGATAACAIAAACRFAVSAPRPMLVPARARRRPLRTRRSKEGNV